MRPKFKVYYQHEDTAAIMMCFITLGEVFDNFSGRYYPIAYCKPVGKKDLYDIDIYEGDILSTCIEGFYCSVVYDPVAARFMCWNKKDMIQIDPASWHKRPIIGNIYQDTDLIKQL